MKKLLSFFLVFVFVFISNIVAHAQYKTNSNTVTTRVGNPPNSEGIATCPIPKGNFPDGTVTCGSKNVPINGCGHCGLGYESYMANCTYPGIYYAMDIAGGDFQDIILPSVEGNTIDWTFLTEQNKTGNQSIQIFTGTNASSGEKFWIQFHHTNPGSGNRGTHPSGERGANICGNGCGMGHVHVEFAKIDPSGQTVWQDAPNFFCK